ncbi:hypothetical protein N7G274_000705 [Stereocaulon virgatum]|uniref:Uncharacterized protein n=1 Tax=Stereocaulon virgatum TaxID=373712 RepID=A0ABR4AVZ4_9LECA
MEKPNTEQPRKANTAKARRSATKSRRGRRTRGKAKGPGGREITGRRGGGDAGNSNQIERAKEQVELEKKQKEQIKADMMKKNDIREAVVTEGKNHLERVEKATRKLQRR